MTDVAPRSFKVVVGLVDTHRRPRGAHPRALRTVAPHDYVTNPDRKAEMRSRPTLLVPLLIIAAVAVSCTPKPALPLAIKPPPAANVPAPAAPKPPVPLASSTDPGPLMGPSRVPTSHMVAWFKAQRVTGYAASVPIETLIQLFIEEGAREGVAGDVAFIQSILETGWFAFPRGQVVPSDNNFAGIGAVDGGAGQQVARFADARTGVRAQIQHLRAYADSTVTCSNFATPNESPRCHLVHPKGRATTWSVMGNGNWATDPNYATKVADLYAAMVKGQCVSSRCSQ